MLIKCPECGKEISDKARQCPKCGFTLHRLNESNRANNKKNKDKKIENEDKINKKILKLKKIRLTKKQKTMLGIVATVCILSFGAYKICSYMRFYGSLFRIEVEGKLSNKKKEIMELDCFKNCKKVSGYVDGIGMYDDNYSYYGMRREKVKIAGNDNLNVSVDIGHNAKTKDVEIIDFYIESKEENIIKDIKKDIEKDKSIEKINIGGCTFSKDYEWIYNTYKYKDSYIIIDGNIGSGNEIKKNPDLYRSANITIYSENEYNRINSN